MTRISSFAVALSAFILLSSTMLLAQEYEIRLSRPVKTGDKYRMLATVQNSEKITMFVSNAAVNEKREEFSIDFAASITVIEIDERGRAVKQALNIEKCLVNAGGITKPLVAAGVTMIAAIEANRTVWKVNDVPIDPMTAKALSMVIPPNISELSDDDVFGTRAKKKIGDTWQINADLAAKSLKETFNISTNKGDIQGASTLDRVVKDGDQAYLVVSSWINIENFSAPLPDGFSVKSGQAKAIFSGRFPVDQPRQRLAETMKMTMAFAADRAAEAQTPAMLLHGAMERNVSRELEPLQ